MVLFLAKKALLLFRVLFVFPFGANSHHVRADGEEENFSLLLKREMGHIWHCMYACDLHIRGVYGISFYSLAT